ncbi:membrane protein [Pontibacter korlensis]|uniref:Membrane protein n=2 Tax=Pontibacter korlensis TaxID=400092 RepID=A0A0E3ZJR7_9BACT|nr:membrane protein [Pontibacter korlensis]
MPLIQQTADVTVTGQVTDENGSGLPGVTVVLQGTTRGTSSDANGNYSLSVPGGGGTLVFSFVGYKTQEVQIGNRSTVNVSLAPDTETLEEVVVVGYGTQQKSLVTGAISSVRQEEIATVSSTRVEQALQGRTAGVSVLPASGSPGSGMRVRVRGAGSNGNAEPLYIVDGMRTGGIEYLDPSEIASIEVLKDAASAAIYGAEGANGVVIITTKTGNKGAPSTVSYSGQYGVQSVGDRMDLMNAQQYAAYLNESSTAGTIPDPAEVSSIQGTNWLDEIFEKAPMQRHSVSFNGGSEKSSFLINGTMFRQDGVVGGDKARFDRYTVRLNSDHEIKSWLNVGNRLSYSHFERAGIQEDSEFGSVISNAILIDPITPTIYTGALPGFVQDAIDAGLPLVRDGSGNYYGLSQYIRGEVGNPLAQIAITKGSTVQNKVVGNLYADIKPFEGFTFTSRFGIDAAFQRNHGWNPSFWFSSERLNTTANTFDTNENWFTWQWENYATYQRTIGSHNFTLLAGTSALERRYNRLNGTSSGLFAEDDIFAFPDYTPDDNDRIAGTENANTLQSYYGRLSYDYENKYLLNLTVRRDGSSLLPPGNEWGTFPSVSVGWVLSNEDFFPANNVVNYFKLRGSWGENGSLSNLTIGQWAAVITSQGIRYPDGNGGYITVAEPAALANPELTWETSEQVDIGLDLGLFDNRLTLTSDYFVKTTKDLITPGTPPRFIGNTLPFVNGGDVRNRGWEFELAFNNNTNPNAFKYEFAVNLTTLDNEVTFLNPNVTRIAGTGVGTGWTATYFEEGYPIWYFRGYKTAGIFQSEDEIGQYLSENGISGYDPAPGDPIVVDVNEDGQISPDDQTFIGSPHPELIYGGRINLSYKGFDFLAFIQGQAGNDVLLAFNRVDRPTANRPAFFYEDRWTGPGSTNSWFAPNTTSTYVYNSDLMLFDGSYARIRQLQLGYTLPNAVTERISVQNARFYVSLDDYFTFTDYPGLDPEAGSNNVNSLGIDRGVYPIPRKALVGLTFNF